MYTAADGTLIDIKADLVLHHRAILVVWPCMTGNTAMYRLPLAGFINEGISVIQFNPRGHGESGGQFDVEQCISDLHEYLDSLKIPETPLWMLGHSAGASCVLRYGSIYGSPERYILVSPVLDSIGSYSYLYSNGNYFELNTLIASMTNSRKYVIEQLADERWMKREEWERNGYREKFDRISGRVLVGCLMQKLFIEGYNTFDDLEFFADRTLIMLPLEDYWFPMDITRSLAKKSNIRIETISEAKDHYFTGAWKHVWRRVLDEMNK